MTDSRSDKTPILSVPWNTPEHAGTLRESVPGTRYPVGGVPEHPDNGTEQRPPEADEVTSVARDLRDILELSEDLHTQAIHRASHPLMPGGAATVDLAPVANLEANAHRREHAERQHLQNCPLPKHDHCDYGHLEDEDDSWPPLQMLLYWSEQWRRHHNRELDTRPTIQTETQFLTGLIQWAHDHEKWGKRFTEFAADIHRARTRLEDHLYAGQRAERTEVPCIDVDCDTRPRLIRVYRRLAAEDGYRCPACRSWYTPERFARAKADLLASEGAERWVRFRLVRLSVNRPERTIRDWLHNGLIASYCDLRTREVYVWWPDVRLQDLKSPTRNRRSA